MERFAMQDNQYVFPYHYLMYGNYPKESFNECLWYRTATDVIVDEIKKIDKELRKLPNKKAI